MGSRIRVGVAPAAALRARARLFAALEAALPVEFVAWSESGAVGGHDRERAPGGDCAALIAITPDPSGPLPPGARSVRVPVLVVAEHAGAEHPPEPTRLAEIGAVDRRVRGIVLEDHVVGPPPSAPHRVLAEARSGPVWTHSVGEAPIHRVRCGLPDLGEDEVLYKFLSLHPVASVALIQFLREVCAGADWRPPPLRAAFVFDDPNLRWHSYGFLDYRRLVRHADRHGYHVAMAMIPLDASLPHGPTVSLFAQHADLLSLVFHGNDHLKDELLLPADETSALAMMAQAVRRVTRFERSTGLGVDRVMMPPHGRCSAATSRALAALGFEALCAIHAQPWTADRPTSPVLAAWRPAEFVGGCAVIPRMAMDSTDATIALRAFLDHPLVVYWHHEDLASGLDPLAEMADRINRLGEVRWTSVGDIARTNVATRLVGEQLLVRPYSGRVRVHAPAQAREVIVPGPDTGDTESDFDGWSVDAGRVRRFDTAASLDVRPVHEVRLCPAAEIDPRAVAPPSWKPWPVVRRLVVEARDRTLPLRAAGFRKNPLAPVVDRAT